MERISAYEAEDRGSIPLRTAKKGKYMLLLGNKDYYDSMVNSAGIDKSIVYNRKLETIIFSKSNSAAIKQYFNTDIDPYVLFSKCMTDAYSSSFSNSQRYIHGLIYFCGKFYPYAIRSINALHFVFDEVVKTNKTFAKYIGSEIFITPDDLRADLETDAKYTNNRAKTKDNHYRSIFYVDDKQLRPIKNFLIENKICCCNFIMTRSFLGDLDIRCMEINPILSDYKFYRVKHITQAYQELGQYISNELADTMNPNTEPLTEKESLMRHGFDKMSFKKCKQGK